MTQSDVISPVSPGSQETELPLIRLYTLRICYFILTVGLGLYMWPLVLHHTSELALRAGVQLSLLAGLGATSALGLRYPVRMLPLLLFEMTWKAIYLVAFALPLWLTNQVNAKAAEDIAACLMVVIFIPLIPWKFVYARYVAKPGERWK